MIMNKWLNLALGVAVVLAGYLGTVDWQTLAPSQAGTIVMILGAVKAILGAIQPPASQTMITSTGNMVFPHT